MTLGQFLLAQGQTFNRRYDLFGQHHGQVAWSIDLNGTDGYSVTSTTNYDDSVYLYITAALLRLDADGELLSESKMLGGMNSIYAGWSNCSQRVEDGGVIIGGSLRFPSDSNHAAIMKYAANGDSLWLREYGSGIGRQVKQTKDGGYILCGEHVVGNSTDAFLMKTDSLGNEEWTHSYGGPFSDYAMSVDTTTDDGYFIGGEYSVSQNNMNFWVLRVDADGDTLWTRQWGGPFDEPNAHLTTLANGNPIIASQTDFINDYAGRMYMAELDQDDGHLVWERRYGPPFAFTCLFACKEVQPGEGTIAAGYFEPPDSVGLLKGVLLRCAPNGDSLWMRTYVYYDSLMTDGTGEFRDVEPTVDGGFIACGLATGSYSGNNPPGLNQDAWVVKVDSLGCIVPGCADFNTAITTQITNLKDALSLYPVPLSPSKGQGELHVGIHLPANFKTDGPLVLSVTSLDGKLVQQQRVPTSGAFPPSPVEKGPGDEGALSIDVSGLAAGTYSVHLSDAHTWIAGKKFVVE